MGTLDLTKVIRTTGRLAISPTDLGTAYPHGGTDLGAVTSVMVLPGIETVDIRAEEFGGEVVETILAGQNPVLVADLRQWLDSDAAGTTWPNTSTTKVLHPSSNRAGYKMSGDAVSVIFTPDNTTAHPAVLFYKAIPIARPEAELPLSVTREMRHPVAFKGIRNGSGLTYEIDLLANLTAP